MRQHTYRALLKTHVDVIDNAMIREATNKDLAVGGERFKDEIERLSGLRVTEKRRGPTPKKNEYLL